MSRVEEYVNSRREETLGELVELLKIPSVSTDPDRVADVSRCAELVAKRLEEAGLSVETFPTAGHPVRFPK